MARSVHMRRVKSIPEVGKATGVGWARACYLMACPVHTGAGGTTLRLPPHSHTSVRPFDSHSSATGRMCSITGRRGRCRPEYSCSHTLAVALAPTAGK
eukprot:scaffold10716_cov113-Isochrysis_galbana.AAC.3